MAVSPSNWEPKGVHLFLDATSNTSTDCFLLTLLVELFLHELHFGLLSPISRGGVALHSFLSVIIIVTLEKLCDLTTGFLQHSDSVIVLFELQI